MWSSVKGVVGLAKTAVEYSVAGTAFVYGKVTGKMPKWAEERMGNAKEFAKKVWQDPFSILEGMGQGLSDTYENEGVSYLAGAFVGDYLIAKGATKAVKAMKKPKSGKVGSEVGGGKKASGAGSRLDINIKKFEIKNKHLNSSTAKRARKFNVSSAEEANKIVQDALKNGKLVETIPNGVGSQGQNSFSSIIDAGKVIGTKGETHIKIVYDELKNVWTTYPVPKP